MVVVVVVAGGVVGGGGVVEVVLGVEVVTVGLGAGSEGAAVPGPWPHAAATRVRASSHPSPVGKLDLRTATPFRLNHITLGGQTPGAVGPFERAF